MENLLLTLLTRTLLNLQDLNLVFTFLFASFDLGIFISLFKIKESKKTIWSAIIIDTILQTVYTIFVPLLYYRLLSIITLIAITKVFFKRTIEECILGELINSITRILPEAVISRVIYLISNNISLHPHEIHYYEYNLILLATILLVRIIIYLFIKFKKITINMPTEISNKNKTKISIISIIGFSLIFFNEIEITIHMTDSSYYVFFFNLLALTVYFYISIQEIFRQIELKNKEQKITNLRNYNRTLTNMYDDIRGFRHDFSNFIQALDGYAQVNDINGIKAMSKDILKDCSKVVAMENLNPKIINNPAIYSILSYKYYNAKKENININIETFIDFSKLKISTYELCRILSILLDNAIEAAKECDNKIINIKFLKDNSIDRNLVIVENSYNNKEVDLEKIFQKGETSKQISGNNHGLGLWNIRKILKRSKNLNLFTYKNELFCQQLEIYN